jgi:hypothetical protein
MNKVDLVRNLVKRAGIPDSEAKIFFEIFLRKASEKMNPGDALRLGGIGTFQLRKGKLKFISPEGEPSSTVLDLIIFNSSNNEQFVFNIPADDSEKSHWADSYFSISIGKPVIPLKGVSGGEFFIPASGLELKRLIESKVDNLLSRFDLLKEFSKGKDYIVIDKGKFNPNQYEINWDSKEQFSKPVSQTLNFEINSSEVNLPWDFGEDFEKQIESESILDLAKDPTSEDDYSSDESLSWNFGSLMEEMESEIDQSSELKEAIEEEKEKIIKADEELSDGSSTRFERVKTLTDELSQSGFNEESKSVEDDTASLEDSFDEEIFNDDIESDENENLLHPTIDESSSENIYSKYDSDLSAGTMEDSGSSEAEEEYEEIALPPIEPSIVAEKKAETKSSPYRTRHRETRYAENKRTPAVIIFASIIIFIIIGYFVFTYFSHIKTNTETVAEVSVTPPPTIIERDYEIPVSYPYEAAPENEAESFKAIPPEVLKPAAAGTEISTVETNTVNENIAKVNDGAEAPVQSVKIDNLIYKDGSTYSVQVSSWQVKKHAETEVQKYSRSGLKSFIEPAELPGRGTWYRVRIGGFNSLTEAKNFLNKN